MKIQQELTKASSFTVQLRKTPPHEKHCVRSISPREKNPVFARDVGDTLGRPAGQRANEANLQQ